MTGHKLIISQVGGRNFLHYQCDKEKQRKTLMTFLIHVQGRNLVSHPSSGNMWTALHAGWLESRCRVSLFGLAAFTWLTSFHPPHKQYHSRARERHKERDREKREVLVQDRQCLAVMWRPAPVSHLTTSLSSRDEEGIRVTLYVNNLLCCVDHSTIVVWVGCTQC